MSLRHFRPACCAVLTAVGCQTSQDAKSETAPLVLTEHIGVWKSDGYGWVVEIQPDTVHLYHVAADVCVRQPASEVTILNFLDLYRSSKNGTALHVSSVLDPYENTLNRISGLPASCSVPAINTPIANFDALTAYYDEHYAFFDLYGVDWKARATQYRASVTDSTSDKALFAVMSELLRPLKDSHIQIDAEIDGESFVYDGGRGKTDVAIAEWASRTGITEDEAVGRFRRGYWIDDIQKSLLGGNGVMAGNGRIQYGIHADGIGYIAFVSMGGYIDGEFATAYQEPAVLDSVLDSAIALFDSAKVAGVIVDVSLNIGGYDFVGLNIARRFAAERSVAFNRRAGDDPTAKDFALFVEPTAGPSFHGPVYLLTSDLTVSAAEILTLSLRALPNVIHVGERTRGAFSTVLTKYLPNGWELSLSNEIYTDPKGAVWEGRGITPTVPIPVFNANTPTTGHVEAVKHVARLIRP